MRKFLCPSGVFAILIFLPLNTCCETPMQEENPAGTKEFSHNKVINCFGKKGKA